ncbi:hypothetical protein DFJ77DRAFT_469878 [Powellomyces hirtus]|nr:hypothetical protein DFJ77DRAFT_469878 [Powellomyces hirtus]
MPTSIELHDHLPDLDPSTPWHTLEASEIAATLQTNLNVGLSPHAVAGRLAKYGPNLIASKQGATWVKILLAQLIDPMNWLFLALGVVGFLLADYITGGFLTAMALINLGLSFSQEYAAEKTLAALKSLSSPSATIVREGSEQQIPTADIVPGDIVVLIDGDAVPADCRVLTVTDFETDESLLTGESMPVRKDPATLTSPDEPLGDRINMVYSSTIVSKGRARALVISTGMSTQIGRIASKLQDDKSDLTRLQKSLYKMYISLIFVAIAGALIVLSVGKFDVTYQLGMYAVTVALSVIPAGLTTVLTVTLVMGGKEMTKHNAIVRKLKSLETLGSVTHIFSDKTGTLTQAKMVVVNCWVPSVGHVYVEPRGIEPIGNVFITGNVALESDPSPDMPNVIKLGKGSANTLNDPLHDFALCASLCNLASVTASSELAGDSKVPAYTTSGSPTEVALQVFAHKLSMSKPSIEFDGGWQPVYDFQFTSTLKRMSVVYRSADGSLKVFTKGAAEILLGLCTPDPERDEKVRVMVDDFARRGLRVILLAARSIHADEVQDTPDAWRSVDRRVIERELDFLGLAAIYDPPRPESASSVRQAHEAGISVHMLTGDHQQTAISIAYQIGILDQDPRRLTPERLKAVCTTGPVFDALSEAEIDAMDYLPLVVARCSPESKVKMIEAAKRRQFISAMTGDGVNDSPSLKIADIGIAMGLSGSDVAKGASDIVLADDNFATIIVAIREGRRLYTNIQRFLLYYWIGLLAAAIIVIVNVAVKDPAGVPVSPFTPIMLLFLFVAMTSPAAAISIQPASPTTMQEPPRPPTESIFNAEIIRDTLFYSLGFMAICLGAYELVLWTGGGVAAAECDATYTEGCEALYRARSTILFLYTLLSLVQSVHCRSYRTVEWMGPGFAKTLRDKTLMVCILVLVVVLNVFVYVPEIGRDGFKMGGVTWEWGLIIGGTLLWIIAGDVWKKVKDAVWPLQRVNPDMVQHVQV